MAISVTPIILFCDFGLPYTGQMKGRLVADLGDQAPNHPIIDLFHDVPAYDVRAGSVLLAAHANDFPVGSIFVAVVDPGVGSQNRRPGVVFAGGRWFVGPLNGLFEHVLRRWSTPQSKVFEITLQPEHLSATFHGRDLFCPMAAALARAGEKVDGLRAIDPDCVRPLDMDCVRPLDMDCVRP
ncbi:MAG: SAM-dependent chlorinase/fluorinase, partial [Magnetovibrio sp.]|nr:SAM-dependent chlorinase/fluorinase [Magnetovibrio sp.]